MLSRWSIKDAPTDKDPERRLLLLKGPLKDIHTLIRRFGAMCGRPKKEGGDSPFNYRLYLHKATKESVGELESELSSMGGAHAEASVEPSERPPAEKTELSLSVLDSPKEAGAPPASSAAASKPVSSPLLDQALFGALKSVKSENSLDTLVVGGFNRFAHAAAMSVLSSPGTMYNPLYVCGPIGAGKSHLLNGITVKLQEQSPGEPVFFTTGARLARAVDAAMGAGRMQELMAFAQISSALVIDDVHLMGVTPENQQGLTDLVGVYRSAQKQILLSSVYSQKLLGGLDEALQFQFHAGHAVEFKTPGENARKKIILQGLDRMGCPADEEKDKATIQQWVEEFKNFSRLAGRLKILKTLREGAGHSGGFSEYAPLLTGRNPRLEAISEEDLDAGLAEAGKSPAEGGEPVLLCYPAGGERRADWAWHQLYKASQKESWPFPFKLAGRFAYDLEPAAAAPFTVAAEIVRAAPSAAFVLGPAAGTSLAKHESDFRYAFERLLSGGRLSLGWVKTDQLKDPNAFLDLYLDLSRSDG